MRFHIITLFPQAFDSYINESILKRAQEKKLIKFLFYNPRDFAVASRSQAKAAKPYLRVDDKPYGGGPGMIIQAEPVAKAIDKALSIIKNKKKMILYLSPVAKHFTNKDAAKLSNKFSDLVIVCGRYEGIDARVKKIHKGEEFSIGNYVLTGGELPAMVITDCISRQIKGVLGDFDSLEESRISSSEIYTRPETIVYMKKKYKVPKVLLSGHHSQINDWKIKGKVRKTRNKGL